MSDSAAKRLFFEALDQPVGRRAAFVETACGGDDRLRREVMELLLYHGDHDSRVDEPVAGAVERLLEELPERLPASPPGYTIEAALGRGGMGSVWLASRVSDGARVAIKLLTTGTHSREMLARFKREAEILRRLDHPGIARLIEAGSHEASYGEQPYLVLEYVEGRSLLAYASEHALDLRARVALLQRVAEAVGYAHRAGVVHRDLKPDNILVIANGQPRVLDFGVARFADESLSSLATRTGLLLGTPQYMSPEQVQAEPGSIGPACDVYALGVLAFEMLGGQLPYDVRTASLHRAVVTVLTVEPPRLGTVSSELRGDLENIVARALEKAPAERYADADAFADDLKRWLEGRPVSVRAPSPLRRAARAIAQRRWVLPLAIAAAVIAVAITVRGWNAWTEEARWRNALGRLEHADDLVHDETNRTVPNIATAVQLLDSLRAEWPTLPERPASERARVFLLARSAEAYFVRGDLTMQPEDLLQASRWASQARGSHNPNDRATLGPGLEGLSGRISDLSPAELDGFVAMTRGALAEYRQPYENRRLQTVALSDARLLMLGRRGLGPFASGPNARRDVQEFPDSLRHGDAFVYLMNDLCAAHTGYAVVARDTSALAYGLRCGLEASAKVAEISASGAAVGSVHFNLGLAWLRVGQLRAMPAAFDSAQHEFETALSYRGPERPHQYAETKRAQCELELARGESMRDPAAQREAAERALAHLADVKAAITNGLEVRRITSHQASAELAFVDLATAQALCMEFESGREPAPSRDLVQAIANAAATLTPDRFPVQAAYLAHEQACIAATRWKRTHDPDARRAAQHAIEDALGLLPAEQDRTFALALDEERALLGR